MSLLGGGAIAVHLQSDNLPTIDPSVMGPVARDNRARFVKNLKEIGGITEGAVFLKGGNIRYVALC
jgi:hypothetical protein